MNRLETQLRWQEITRSQRSAKIKVAILATFTPDPVVPYLGTALEDAGLPAEIFVGPYNQIVQQCLSDDSTTARFAPDILICWPRLEELWGRRSLPLSDDAADYAEDGFSVAAACLEAAGRWRSLPIFVLPAVPDQRPLGIGDASNPKGVYATASQVREALRQWLGEQQGGVLFDLEDAIRNVGANRSYDPRLFTLARIPFSDELFRSAGKSLARLIVLTRQPARKVLVVDADNTLWGGYVGEDSPEDIDLADSGPGEAYRAFQSFLLELRRAGLLLALCSKNDESDVWQVFARPEMRLKKSHLAAWRVNWQAKSKNLRELADQLGVSTDSLIFIDDSPVEIAEVKAALSEVACIRMPEDPVQWVSEIQHAGVLDRLPPTSEDLRRANSYEQEQRRHEAREQTTSAEEYLATLDVHVSMLEPTPAHLPRLAQLVAKTNQLNLNCRRRSQAELSELCADRQYFVRLASATDRFGDYGVVGALIAKVNADGADVDTFLLSCRALGRGIEEAMIATLFEEVAQPGNGSSQAFATLEECPRNEPARNFFTRLGCVDPGVRSPLRRLDWPASVARA
jgi:FkbH-like protein